MQIYSSIGDEAVWFAAFGFAVHVLGRSTHAALTNSYPRTVERLFLATERCDPSGIRRICNAYDLWLPMAVWARAWGI